MERSIEKTLHENEQEETCKTLGRGNPKEDDDDLLGSLAVLEPSTSLSDWPYCCCQSPLLELPNKRRNCQRNR